MEKPPTYTDTHSELKIRPLSHRVCVCLYVLCRPGRDGAGAGGGNKVGAGGGEGGMARGRGERGV